MKIRNGFVSNSSSSSFIIVGIKVYEADLKDIFGDDYNEVYDGNKKLFKECSVIDDETNVYIGKILTYCEYLEDNKFSIDQINEYKSTVYNELNKYKVKTEDINLYTGTRY